MSFNTGQSAYKALRNIIAERTSDVIFWTGSGLSAEVGLPTWPKLRNALVKALIEQINQLDVSERGTMNAAVRVVREEQNNWRAFNLLKDSLGDTTWRAIIRENLRMSALINPPVLYDKMWQLNPQGVLTLNLDRLATKSYTDLNRGPILTEFVGGQVANYTHVLKHPHPFICQLHGNVDDSSSWILTSSDLNRRLSDLGYQNFIKSSLSTKTIVLIGISADDVAVGGFLDQLSSLDIDASPHYWITSRRDWQTNRWAEERGIRLIRYDAPDEDHSEVLEAFDDLVTYVSVDDPADSLPIIPEGIESGSETLPDQNDLLTFSQDAESLRNALNREATRILSSTSPDAIKDYMVFSRDYDEAIYRAWHTSTNTISA